MVDSLFTFLNLYFPFSAFFMTSPVTPCSSLRCWAAAPPTIPSLSMAKVQRSRGQQYTVVLRAEELLELAPDLELLSDLTGSRGPALGTEVALSLGREIALGPAPDWSRPCTDEVVLAAFLLCCCGAVVEQCTYFL